MMGGEFFVSKDLVLTASSIELEGLPLLWAFCHLAFFAIERLFGGILISTMYQAGEQMCMDFDIVWLWNEMRNRFKWLVGGMIIIQRLNYSIVTLKLKYTF